MHIQTEGLILRETAYRESDKMLTVLTRKEGKLSVLARGSRRRGSPLVAATQLLAYSDCKLFSRNGRYQLDEADTLDLFFELRNDLKAFSIASYCAELMDAVCTEGEPHEEILRLGIWVCRMLGNRNRSQELVKAAFELRLMSLLGFEPQLDGCGVCGRRLNTPGFHITHGVAHCPDCRDSLPDGVSVPLTAGVYDAMRHILGCEHNRLSAFTLSESDTLMLGSLCERYTIAHTERGYTALGYYHCIAGNI